MSSPSLSTCTKFLQFTQTDSPKSRALNSTIFSSQLQSHYFRASVGSSAWSPDGTCLLIQEGLENVMRLFELPQRYYDVKEAFADDDATSSIESAAPDAWPICLSMHSQASPIYDCKWNPLMDSALPESAFFVTSSKGGLLTLWDAFKDNCKRETLRVTNHLNRTMDAFAIEFQPGAESLICGLNHSLSIIPLEAPQKFTSINTQNFFYPKLLSSIISTVTYNQAENHTNMFAFGNYNGDVAWVDDRTNQLVQCIESVRRIQLHGMEPELDTNVPLSGNGITQVQFSPCGNFLFTAARNDSYIHCWDIRSSPTRSGPVYSMYRDAQTNQRIGFDVTHNQLITGSRGGEYLKYNLAESGKLLSKVSIQNGCDAVNGVAFHPILPYFAVCSGERHIRNVPRDDTMSDDSDDESPLPEEIPLDPLVPPVVQMWFDRSLMVA